MRAPKDRYIYIYRERVEREKTHSKDARFPSKISHTNHLDPPTDTCYYELTKSQPLSNSEGARGQAEPVRMIGRNDLLPETLSHPEGLSGEQSAQDGLLVAHGTRNDLCDDEDCPISPQTQQNNASWTPEIKINQKTYRNNQTGNPKIKNMTFFFKNEPGGTIFKNLVVLRLWI